MFTKTSHRLALRSAFVAASFSTALSAHAWIISGAGDTNAGGAITTVDYQFSNLAGIVAPFGSFTLYNVGNGAFTGSFTSGGNTLNVASAAGNVNFANNTYSFSGVWNVQAGTNVAVAPTGTYSATFDLNSLRYEYNVAGAVPEPASMVALGVGVGALLRRRRKG